MIDQIVFAKNRADLEAAARALDRILLWNHYVVRTMTKREPRDGIASVIPIQCRNSAWQLFPLFGGGTSKKPQKRARSRTDIQACLTGVVRITSQIGHRLSAWRCPLSAKSRRNRDWLSG
jgi:hypothetical protein